MPYNDWTAGDTVTAANIMTYHMKQAVMVFTDEDDRDSQLSGSLEEGMVAYIGGPHFVQYDGSSWVTWL